MAEYKDLVQLVDEQGINLLAVLPTGVAYVGDVALIDDEILLTVIATEWIDINSKTFDIIKQTCDIVDVEKIFKQVWNKEEETND